MASLTTAGKSSATQRAIRSDLVQFCIWWEQTNFRPFDLTQVVERDLHAWKARRLPLHSEAQRTLSRSLQKVRCPEGLPL